MIEKVTVGSRVQKVIDKLFPRIERCFPGAILAGGAIRDMEIGKCYPNDLDFFVPFDGTIQEATLRLLNEGLCSISVGKADYHFTCRDIETNVKERLTWGSGSKENLNVLFYHDDSDCGKVEIILSPIAADTIGQWYVAFQQIPLNTGYMFADGRKIIPAAMRADLDTKRVTVMVMGNRLQRARAEDLARRFGWPLNEVRSFRT